MKTKTKNFLLAALIASVILFSSFLGEKVENKFLTVRCIESSIPAFRSRILVMDEKGEDSEVALSKFSDKQVETNLAKLTEVLNKLGSRGYDLMFNTSSSHEGVYINTFVFVKK